MAKKRQPLSTLLVTARAERAPEAPRVFTRIHVTYYATGEALTQKAVEDAVALSKEKYCSVSIMLGHSVEITSAIELGAPQAEGAVRA